MHASALSRSAGLLMTQTRVSREFLIPSNIPARERIRLQKRVRIERKGWCKRLVSVMSRVYDINI